MTTDSEILEMHANALANELEYPEEMRFAEEFAVRPEDTRIPTENYISPEVLREEIDTVWMHTWQMACRVEDLAGAGAYHEYTIADQSYLVVRGDDDQIRAFQNTCLHRGKLIRTGTGTTDELRCGYHYWCWDLKGKLKEVPDQHAFPGLKESEYSLGEIACDTWGGFVFVNPDRSGPSLEEFLGPVVEQLAPYRLDEFRATMHSVVELPCNWKVALEAFIETYHVQGIHPQIMPYVDDFNTKFQLMGDHTRMIVPFGVPSMRLEHVDQAEVFEQYYTVAGRVETRDKSDATQRPPARLPQNVLDEDGEWTGPGSVRDHLIEATLARGRAMGHDYSGLQRAQLVDDYHYHLFPSVAFNLHAGALLLFRARPHATDPDRCWFDVYTFRTPDLTAPPPEPVQVQECDLATTSFGLVLDQDFENLVEVQRGLHAKSVHHVTVGALEIRIINFHESLMKYRSDATTV